jgi:malate dehydrogenase (oxaloacetate-decarboxylating)(NADP+)
MALAELALRGEAVPNVVREAYPNDVFDFGPSYIIPKPFDPRMLIYVPLAVAQAAMESGVARRKVDLVAYRKRLEETVGHLANL